MSNGPKYIVGELRRCAGERQWTLEKQTHEANCNPINRGLATGQQHNLISTSHISRLCVIRDAYRRTHDTRTTELLHFFLRRHTFVFHSLRFFSPCVFTLCARVYATGGTILIELYSLNLVFASVLLSLSFQMPPLPPPSLSLPYYCRRCRCCG